MKSLGHRSLLLCLGGGGRKSRAVLLALFFPLLFSSSLFAQTPALPEVDLSSILPTAFINNISTVLAGLTSHRPLSPATSLGQKGFSIGLELTLMGVPTGFSLSPSETGTSSAVPSLPMAKLHLRKGAGTQFEAGISGLYYPGLLVGGGDLKWTFFQPEEGLNWALRAGFSLTKINLKELGVAELPIESGGVSLGSATLEVMTRSYELQIVGSKKMGAFEPYIGAGLSLYQGQLSLPVTLQLTGQVQTLATAPSFKAGGVGFVGLSSRIPYLGLKANIEGAYSTLGLNYLSFLFGVEY